MSIDIPIKLRELRKNDVEKINSWRNDFETKRLTLGMRFPISLELDLSWFQSISMDTRNKNIYFAIEEGETGFLGLIQLTSIDWINRNAEVGILIGDSASRGKKIGYRSLILLLDYAFNIINLHKVTSHIVDYNKISIALFKSCGFIEEGCLKGHICFDGKRSDLKILSVFQKDFLNILYKDKI
jgi:RimJ/RimL family protein N-acetyltransferase